MKYRGYKGPKSCIIPAVSLSLPHSVTKAVRLRRTHDIGLTSLSVVQKD